jgi:hypothetical protein
MRNSANGTASNGGRAIAVPNRGGRNSTYEACEDTDEQVFAHMWKRPENQLLARGSNLRGSALFGGIQLTPEDMDDIHSITPLMLATDDLAGYNLTYSGQQHVDDLDTWGCKWSRRKKKRTGDIFREESRSTATGFPPTRDRMILCSFGRAQVHIREIIKYTRYNHADAKSVASDGGRDFNRSPAPIFLED